MNEFKIHSKIEVPSLYWKNGGTPPNIYQSDDEILIEVPIMIDNKSAMSMVYLKKTLLRDILDGKLK